MRRNKVAWTSASPNMAVRAQELRQRCTTAEALLWQFLRGRRLHHYKFRRQHPIGTFITDFFCAEANLIIEVDGAVHQECTQQERDRLREEILQLYGFAILRFNNDEVFQFTEAVLESISSYLLSHSNEK